MTIRTPVGGVNERTSFQSQPPYTAYSASNVWPDNVAQGRERIGVRPGLKTAVTGTLPGPIRMMHEINVQTSTGTQSTLVCSANGNFYRYNVADGDWDNVSSAYTLAADRLIQAAVFGQKLYIADYGIDDSGINLVVDDDSATVVHLPEIADSDTGAVDSAGTTFNDEIVTGTDGALNSANNTFISAGSTFVTDGVTPTTHVLRQLDTGDAGHAVVGVYAISSVDSETQLTLATTPHDGTSETGVDFEVNLDFANAGVTTSHYLRVKTTGTSTNAVVDAYAISAVNQDRLTVPDITSDASATDAIGYEVRPAIDTTLTANDHGLEILEEGNGTAGFYTVSNVEEDQVTLGSSPGSTGTTGLHYRFHRVPKVWDLSDDTIAKWTTSAGTLPLSCNVITYFQDRIILAGAPEYSNIWYASAQGDPTDFNYDGDDAGSAVSGTTFTNGKIGDPITALIPHNRQCLVIGAEDSLYVMRGDPNSPSSTIDQVSAHLGPISSQAWCKDAAFHTWMLTRDGLYRMNSGCGDTPISFSREKLPNKLLNLDATDYVPQLKYDLLQRAILVYVPMRTVGAEITDGVGSGATITSATITDWEKYNVQAGDVVGITSTSGGGVSPTSFENISSVSGGTLTLDNSDYDGLTSITFRVYPNSTDENLAYWIDTDRGGVWPMSYDDGLYPSAMCEYAYLTSDSASSVIFGGVDGVARHHDRDTTTDAGSNFTGTVSIGPFALAAFGNRGMIRKARLTPSNITTQVSWEVIASNSAEAAARELPTTPPVSGEANYYTNTEHTQSRSYTTAAGYLQTQWPRISGAAGMIKVTGTGARMWGVESIELEIAEGGRLR